MINKLSKLACLSAASILLTACVSNNTHQSSDPIGDKFSYIKTDGSTATDQEVAERVKYLVEVSDPRTPEDRLKDVAYRKKYKDAIVIQCG